jgi:mannose-1-phosphate guanylyltransferase
MRALLLAAGLGTRLRPLTNHIPKCLVPIGERPLLDYWLHSLFASGVDRVLVNTHYHESLVIDFLRNSKFKDRIDTVSESKLLGTAGTIANNYDYFAGQSCLVAHADNFCVCDFNKFIAAHENRPSHTCMTMMTFDAPDPKQCGVIELDANQVVQQFFEKVNNPPTQLANAAVYILEESVTEHCRTIPKVAPDLSVDVIPEFLGQIFTWHNALYHIDIGTQESYTAANQKMIELEPEFNKLGWFESPLAV